MPKYLPQIALQQATERGFVHIDVGGEGHYADATNVNPHGETSGTPPSPIPRWVESIAESLPFPDRCADLITVESAPMWGDTASELVRVIKKGGEIHLLHTEEQKDWHDQVVSLAQPSSHSSSIAVMDHDGFSIRFVRTTIKI